MIDIGVASPSAQGQAMISTATALTSAKPSAGGGPTTAHAAKVRTATRRPPARTSPATWSASRWIGRARALRLGDHRDDAREQRVGADPLGAHHKGAGLVDRRRR